MIHKKLMVLVLSVGVIAGSAFGINRIVFAADTTVTPVVDQTAPVGSITKLMVTFFGDTNTEKGFTWYTSRKSITSDLQIVEQTSKNQTPNFANTKIVKTFVGTRCSK